MVDKININVDKIKTLSDVLKNYIFIIKKTKFKLKKKKQIKEYRAIDTIYVSLDRLNDTAIYLNEMVLNRTNSSQAFDFYDFINNSYVIINCIYHIAEVFNIDLSDIKENKYHLQNIIGLDSTNDECSDDDYFYYIRSISSVHPIVTDRHHKICGESFHTSPFSIWLRGINKNTHLCIRRYVDFEIKDIHLNIYDIYNHIYSKIDFIDKIIENVNNYISIEKEKLINTRMKSKNDFVNYMDYLYYLKEEANDRDINFPLYTSLGDNFFVIDLLLNRNVSNIDNQIKINLYINAIKYSIEFYHQSLQLLDINYSGIKYPNKNHETDLLTLLISGLEYPNDEDLYYFLSKTEYLIDTDRSQTDITLIRKLIYSNFKKYMETYFQITENEDNEELFILIKTTLYFYNLENNTMLNRNIPNDLNYRLKLLTDEEMRILINDNVNADYDIKKL